MAREQGRLCLQIDGIDLFIVSCNKQTGDKTILLFPQTFFNARILFEKNGAGMLLPRMIGKQNACKQKSVHSSSGFRTTNVIYLGYHQTLPLELRIKILRS